MGQATHIHNMEKVANTPTGIMVECTECEQWAHLEGEEAKKFEAAAATQTSVELELVDPMKK